jgi:hypothetical protein
MIPIGNAMRLPWAGRAMPHATLDILRGCNITCKGCYNSLPDAIRPLEEIEADLEDLLSLRRLHTVTISGGEPMLHPELTQVVRMVASRGLKVALLTNGVSLDEDAARELEEAGLSIVLLHVQRDQDRPDVPGEPMAAQLRSLRQRKAEIIAARGMEVGLSIVGYRNRLTELKELVLEVLHSPIINFLLVTEFTSFAKLDGVTGDVISGLRARTSAGAGQPDLLQEELRNEEVSALLAELGFHPFAYLGSSVDASEPRWLSYLGGTVVGPDGQAVAAGIKNAFSDRVLIRLARLVTGRYLFLYRAGPFRFGLQLLLNGLSGGNLGDDLRLLAGSLGRGRRLLDKHLLFQQGPHVSVSGELVHCMDCPDATVRNGRLVPVCLADRLLSPSAQP